MSAFRIYVNDSRVATCVPLKDGSFLQVFPMKKVFASRGAWVGEWANNYESLRIETQYPKEYDTESDVESTSISEEEESEYESEEDSETESESESEEDFEEETMIEWRPNSYNNNNTAMDWLLERLWAKGERPMVPAHRCKCC